jgi:hypothetical protein
MQRRLVRAAAAVTAAAALAALGGSSPVAASSTPNCPKPPRVDPTEFGHQIDNPYFPLKPGTTFRYRGTSEGEPSEDVMVVTNQTKTIIGVETTVVRDSVYVNGKLVEDTDDWYAQDDDGAVWYFGEDTKEFDANGNVVSTEGSWEAGKDGARAGIFMPGKPRVGQVFHQELARGVAEDCFQIVDLHASVDTPYVSSTNAMKTKEFTRLDPGVIDTKWYVRGVGMVRDKGPDDLIELVSVED